MLIPPGPFISRQSLFANFLGEVSEENGAGRKEGKMEKDKKKVGEPARDPSSDFPQYKTISR